MLHFNNILDAVVAGAFLVLVVMIVLLSAREWVLLLVRRRLAVLHESQPVWLSDYALAEAKPLSVVSLLALLLGLARELSGEAQLERAQHAQTPCLCAEHAAFKVRAEAKSPEELYLEHVEQRFSGSVNRCC
jgi:hypothetical protein